MLCLFMLLGMVLPDTVSAQESAHKVVRVGWFESTYSYRNPYGERRGIAYEYQQRIAAHTGWTFQYVEDSWPNLYQKLINGEIDLLSDVSYKEERTEFLLYPDAPMGTESYYLYIDASNNEINPDNLRTLDQKRVGVNKGSFQEGLLIDWTEKNRISIELVELTDDEADNVDMLTAGEIDAFVSMDNLGGLGQVIPVTKIGSSDYYMAVSKARPDLLAELNTAITAIWDEDPYFNQHMLEQYVDSTKTNAFLMPSLVNWLAEHGPVRVGYLDNYLPFCSADKQTGALDGALKDYLAHASGCLKNVEIRFEAVPYSSISAAVSAMKNGEVDCVFPVNLSTNHSETMEIFTTNPIMKTEMSVLMREEARPDMTSGNHLTVAVEEENIAFETLIRDHFPDWTIKYYPGVEECFRAVAEKEADSTLVCNYRMSGYDALRTKYRLIVLPAGKTMELSFAINTYNPELYSILNKISNLGINEDIEYSLVSYIYANKQTSFREFLIEYWSIFVFAATVVFFIFIFLLYQKVKAERKANEQQRLLEEAAEIAELKSRITSLLDNMPGRNFTKDAETGVYLACNQAFAVYARRRNPEEIIGCTDAQIFDAETAKRFVEDDKMALSMDQPYIFFEDVPDAAGNQRHIKNTRLKYSDASGRLCVLGISLDVTTDTVHIHRENATTKGAYEKARSSGMIYAHIAKALARGYKELYYVNLDTEEFIEYRTAKDSGSLTETRRGWHFFEECQEEIRQMVYPEDRETVLKAMDRKTLVNALEQSIIFVMTYRLVSEKGPLYVRMKVSRMEDDERYIILGITDVDEEMKQRNAAARMKEEQIAYTRLSALAGDFLCIYIVIPETGQYREFSATTGFETFARAREGMDFFADSRAQSRTAIYPEDQNRFLSLLTGENVMNEIRRHGIFTLSYRLMMDGKPRYVQLKAVMVEEKEGPRLVVGLNDIDSQVRQEEEYVRHLAKARIEANIDALTGVKNRHAYLMAEERLNIQIEEERIQEFAIVILDVNDLKKVNDTAGHKAGDQFLRDACKIVCNIFKHSPVYRVGGDEFAVISQGDDYVRIDELIREMEEHNLKAIQTGGIVIACGMGRYEKDASVALVFERADQNMYVNKSALKEKKKQL